MTKQRAQPITPDDILIAIAHYLPQGRKCFRYGAEKLNTFFYNQKPEHPELLKCLLFDTNGNFPACEDIYQAVSRLVTSGLVIVRSNFLKPEGEYHFHPAVEGSFQQSARKRFSRQQISELETLSKEFDAQIAMPESISFN